MTDTFIFDLYGTLVDIHTEEDKPELWEKLSAFYGFYGAFYSPLQLQSAYQEEVRAELEKQSSFHYPELDLEKVFFRLYQRKKIEPTKELVLHTGQFFRILSTEHISVYDGVFDMLSKLRKMGKQIYLLSNAQEMFTAYELSYLGLKDCFDGILLSSKEGVRKPDTAFFERLLTRYRLDKSKCIMVGNDPISDIEGAYRTGLRSVYICTDKEIGKGHPLYTEYCILDGDMQKLKELLFTLASEA